MARHLNKLNDVGLRGKLRPGRHSDGGNLYLSVSNTGSKSWVFMWSHGGRRREMGMGSYPEISLASARAKAASYRIVVEQGTDPLIEKHKEVVPTYEECVERYLSDMEGQWKNTKHRAQWRMTLTSYCPALLQKRISSIEIADILKVLSPIWHRIPETASRLRGRLERVLDYAKVKGWRMGDNPAAWRGNLKHVLPPPKKLSRGHHPAMHYELAPAFYDDLQKGGGVAARALQLVMLTACRTGEVLGAVWDEIDLDQGVWTIPAVRMKAGREHRVPLSPGALAIFHELRELRSASGSDFVFFGMRDDKSLSDMAMAKVLERMKVSDATVHGFRSTFRDWVGDKTNFQREVAEACLAHSIGDETEEAYRRMDALNKRRRVLEAWEAYLTGKKRTRH